MKLGIGPTLRIYTISQAAVLFGLSWFLTFRVSPTRAAIVTALIAAVALALSSFTWSLKDKIPSTAAYVSGITAELGLSVPVANHPIVLAAVERLVLPFSLGLSDRIMLAATILIFTGSLTVGLGAFVHSLVKKLPQGWRTPLWGGTGNAPTASVAQLRDRQRRRA